MEHNEMIEKLKDNSIKSEELYNCLKSKNFSVLGQTIYKIIDRKYCDKYIIMELTKIASMLSGYKVIGPYQMGHLAIATLVLIKNELALDCFKQIYNDLNDNDKFLVDNFIKGMQEKSDE